MSTLFYEETMSPFDILYRNYFKADEAFAPALNSKQPHPLDIYHDKDGLYFGLSRKSFNLGYKIVPKFDLTKITAEMENGLLLITLPLSVELKPKSIKIK